MTHGRINGDGTPCREGQVSCTIVSSGIGFARSQLGYGAAVNDNGMSVLETRCECP